jgi:hypothetical protein
MSTYKEIADNIATDIATTEGQCILLLGPELSVTSDGTYYKSYFKSLAQGNEKDVKYFESENIFAFKDEYTRDNYVDKIRSFYAHVGDQALLHLIARVQFPLIINVCPDKALNKLYNKARISGYTESDSYYFNAGKESADALDVRKPSKERPMIYNLFGDCEVTESLIYDHSTLYKGIEYLLNKNSLPGKVQGFIDKANSYIFLGFDFDSWHYQLVCHKLELGRASLKKSYGSPELDKSKNVGVVMRDYFKVKFIDQNPTSTIESIIESCKCRDNTLRQLDPLEDYGVYVSYAWRDKKVDILEMLEEVLKSGKTDTAKLEKIKALLKHSGKLVTYSDKELLQIFKTGGTVHGETIETWHKKLPVSRAAGNEGNANGYDREDVVDDLCKALTEKGVHVFRDRNELTYGDSVDSFMNRIGTGKVVIRVISDKYLKSRYCMDEALRIERYLKNESMHVERKARIYTIVLKDDIEKNLKISGQSLKDLDLLDNSQILYMKYWDTLIKNIHEVIDNSTEDLREKKRLKDYYNVYWDIYDYVIPFIRSIQHELRLELSDVNYKNCLSSFEDSNGQKERLNAFVDAIVSKLKTN